MKITFNENEIRDAILYMLMHKAGKVDACREDIRIHNVGIGDLKLTAEINVGDDW